MEAKCKVCGKTETIPDGTPRARVAAAHPDDFTCLECFKAGGSNKSAATKKATISSKPAAAKAQINAEVLRQSYDEVVAAFADVIDDVKDYLGGWTTTVALSKK